MHPAHIGVVAEKGVVTLTGFVSSYAEKMAAERAARRVRGVRAIAQEIQVRLPWDKKCADDEIAQRAANILQWDVEVPHERIQIEVEQGFVTLSGEVEWNFQKEAAERDILRLSGVMALANKIEVTPRLEPADVQQQIEDALLRNAAIEATRITSEAEGGTIILHVNVNSWTERELAEEAAWAAPGVSRIENRLTVVPMPQSQRGEPQEQAPVFSSDES